MRMPGGIARLGWVQRVLLALGLAFILSGPALAACEGDEYPLSTYTSDVMREYLLSTIGEIESYFEIQFPDVCMDDNENGAYIDLARDGTMVIGTTFIWGMAELSLNHVAAVLAHESAHRFQSVHEILDNLQVNDKKATKCIELHADFMAGGFMRHRAEYMTVKPEAIAAEFYELGDGDIYARDHHGLGGERQLSFAAGFSILYPDVYTNATTGMIYVSRAKCDPT